MQRRAEHDLTARSNRRQSRTWRGETPPADRPETEIARPPIPAQVLDTRRRARATSCLLAATPSWLMSLILHLGCMLMMASLVVPLSRHSRLDRLWVSFGAAQEAERSQSPITVVVPQATDEQPDPEPMADAASPAVDPAEPTAPAPTIDLSKVDWSALTKFAHDRCPRKNLLRRREPASCESIQSARMERPLDSPMSVFEPSEDDSIVDQFIEFDVGRLGGKAGRQANQRFQRLGSQAIPALVRGLNKSASIHASCPVGVISRKLEQLIHSTNDRSRIEYALHHLGRDIPKGAPHRSRVFSLRNRIAKNLGQRREFVASGLKKHGWAVDDRTAFFVSQSMTLSESELVAHLRSEDADTRAIAAMAITLGGNRQLDQPSRIGLAIADALESEPDARVSELMDQASASLAGRLVEPGRNAEEWRAFWKHQDRVSLIASLTTPRLLRRLQASDELTRLAIMDVLSQSNNRSISHAMRFEFARGIIPELDSSSADARQLAERALVQLARGRNAGQSSSDRWQEFWQNEYLQRSVIPRSEAQLQQAQTLEQRGNHDAALRRYER